MAMRQYDDQGGERAHDGGEPAVRVATDPTVAALDALEVALGEISREQQQLVQRIGQLRRARQSGSSWQQILSQEEPPGTMQLVSQMLARMSRAS
ncbi:MAG TPA: hypothetical protein VHW47_04865, partial [Acidimicrobiales bacterium]|nr:hypothetical protein [Acidimicrobiales bacterium]